MKLYLVEEYIDRYEPAYFLGIALSLDEAVNKIKLIDCQKVDNPLDKLNGIIITEVTAGDIGYNKEGKMYNYSGVEVKY